MLNSFLALLEGSTQGYNSNIGGVKKEPKVAIIRVETLVWQQFGQGLNGGGFMASIPVKQTPTVHPKEAVEERFRRLAAAWHMAVAHDSSTTVGNNHPAYREIIALGPEVVPLLLRDHGNTT